MPQFTLHRLTSLILTAAGLLALPGAHAEPATVGDMPPLWRPLAPAVTPAVLPLCCPAILKLPHPPRLPLPPLPSPRPAWPSTAGAPMARP